MILHDKPDKVKFGGLFVRVVPTRLNPALEHQGIDRLVEPHVVLVTLQTKDTGKFAKPFWPIGKQSGDSLNQNVKLCQEAVFDGAADPNSTRHVAARCINGSKQFFGKWKRYGLHMCEYIPSCVGMQP